MRGLVLVQRRDVIFLLDGPEPESPGVGHDELHLAAILEKSLAALRERQDPLHLPGHDYAGGGWSEPGTCPGLFCPAPKAAAMVVGCQTNLWEP